MTHTEQKRLQTNLTMADWLSLSTFTRLEMFTANQNGLVSISLSEHQYGLLLKV